MLRASGVAVFVVVLFYLGLNAIFLLTVPSSDIAGQANVATVVAGLLGGPQLRQFLSITIALALLTSVSSMTLLGPRVYAQMAEDGVFPKFFRWRGGVPRRAIAFQVVMALLFLYVSTLRELMTYAGYLLSLSTAFAVLCTLLDPKTMKPLIPWYPWPPLLFLGATLGTTVFLISIQPVQALWSLMTMFTGLVFYYAMRRL